MKKNKTDFKSVLKKNKTFFPDHMSLSKYKWLFLKVLRFHCAGKIMIDLKKCFEFGVYYHPHHTWKAFFKLKKQPVFTEHCDTLVKSSEKIQNSCGDMAKFIGTLKSY